MPKSGKHLVNNIDSFFKVRPSISNIREGESISFLEKGKLFKQEKRNGIVYQQEFTQVSPTLSTDTDETGNIHEIIAGAGLTGGGLTGEVTLDVVGGTGIDANADDIAIDSTVATLTGTQTLTNKTLASPAFTGDINFTDASTPVFNVTDTTNTVTTKIQSANSAGLVGTSTDHNFNVIRNNVSYILLQDGTIMINNPGNDVDVNIKDSSANSLFRTDAGNSRVGILDATPSYTLDVNGTGRFTGAVQLDNNLTITGDLTVQGDTTTLNTATLQVEDKNIVLNYHASSDTSGSADGAGITIQDAVNSTTDATMLWDATNDEFDFSHAINVTGNISVSGTVDGRDLATDGSKLDGIEALADITDTANVTSAGALMDSEVTNLSFVKGLTSGISSGNVLVANSNVADNDFLRIDGTSVEGRTAAQVKSDLSLGTLADKSEIDDIDQIGAGVKLVTGETFVDSDANLMTAGAIDDRIDAKISASTYSFTVTADSGSNQGIASGNTLDIAGGTGISTTVGATDTVTVNVAKPSTELDEAMVSADSFLIFDGTSPKFISPSNVGASLALADLSGTLAVNKGGTGATSLTSNAILTGNGTSAIQAESNLTFDASDKTLLLDGTGASAELATFKWYQNEVQVAGAGTGNAQNITLNATHGTTLNTLYRYKITLTTRGTGTDTGAVYIVSYDEPNTTWIARMVSRAGSTSNHPLLNISGSNAQAYHNHSSTYYIAYSVESKYVRESDGTFHNFGADYHWQRDVDTLSYSDGDVNIDSNTLFVDASTDRVGIGVSNPARTLEVAGAIELSASDNTLDTNNFALRRDSGGGGNIDVPGSMTINLDANNNETTAQFEICHDGGSTPVFKVQENGYTTALRYYLEDTGAVIYRNNNDLELITYSGYDINLMPSGNVGIGTASPSSKLEVEGNVLIASGSQLNFNNSSDANYGRITADSEGLTFDTVANRHIRFKKQGTEVMRINTSANVGIGTASPSEKLEVSGGGADTFIEIHNSGGYESGLKLVGGSLDIWKVYLDDADNNFYIYEDSNQKLKITAAGAVTFNNAYTFPTSDGSSNQILRTNGSGTLSFATFSVGIDQIDASDILTSSESFSDSNDFLMTAAAINDRIESFGYGTGTMSSWTLEGDSGSTTVTNGNTVDIAGGTGITTVASLDSGRDTVTVNFSAGTNDLSDVSINSGTLANGQILQYSSAESAFVNATNSSITMSGSTTNGVLTRNSSTEATVESNLTFDGNNLAIASDGILYFGGDSHTFIREVSDDNLTIAVGGTNLLDLVEDTTDYVRVRDNTLLAVGSSNDMNFKHNGTNSFITNGTGQLYIDSLGQDEDFFIRVNDGGSTITALRIDSSENGRVKLPRDNQKLTIGAANDLQMFHDGSNTYIDNTNAGLLYIRNTVSDADISIQGSDGGSMITALTFDMSDAGSATFSHDVKVNDNGKLKAGSGNDFHLIHDGSHNYIMSNGSDQDIYIRVNDGGTMLTAIRTDSSDTAAVKLPNDGQKLTLGASDDLRLQHNGSHSFIQAYGTGDLYFDNNNDNQGFVFRTDDGSGGVTTYLKIDGDSSIIQTKVNNRFDDSKKLLMGGGSDLHMYHDGTHSYLYNYTGDFKITNFKDDKDIIFSSDDGSGGTTPYITLDGSLTRNVLNVNTRVPDSVIIGYGASDDLQIYHNGTNSFGADNYTGALIFQQRADNADIIFKNDDGSGGVTNYLVLDGNNERIEFDKKAYILDNVKFEFGTGADLRIYHDGSNSSIENHTGALYIDNHADDQDIIFRTDDGGAGASEVLRIDASDAGAIKLPNDNQPLYIGAGNDIAISHNGTNSVFNNNTGTLQIRNLTADADMFLSVNDGGSHINAIQIDTSDTSRVILPRDNQKLTIGAGYDLNFYNNGSASYVQNNNNVFYINQEAAATMQIRNGSSDQDITFAVNDGGSSITAAQIDASNVGSLVLPNDNQNFYMGASNDFRIVHNGTDSYVNNYTGDLIIAQHADNEAIFLRGDDGSGGTTTYLSIDGNNEAIYMYRKLNVYTAGGNNIIEIFNENDTGAIADTFAGNTSKSYIKFGAGTASNDPGFILHETRGAEANEGVIHLCPSDDNADGDYISIHGTNDADSLKLHTSGRIEGVSVLQVDDGSAGAPSMTLNDDNNTGLYSSGADSFNVTTGGTERAQFNSLGLKVVNGALGVNVAPNGTDGRIDASNDVVAFSTSDKRLKENIKPLDNALNKVLKISGVEFDWKELTEEEKKTIHGNEGHDVGVIAQEVEEVLPEVVTTRDSGYKAVKYEKLVPLLIESIKELKEEVNGLKTKLGE